jgi:hypothetical protein
MVFSSLVYVGLVAADHPHCAKQVSANFVDFALGFSELSVC